MSIKKTNNKLLLAYYGDDFTGSTDALEALALNGIPTALFLEPPSADAIKNFRLKRNISGAGDGTLKAFGVAGTGRSMTPEEMDRELPSVFKKILSLKAPVFHYKVCSTFDSSPKVGNIGRAAEIARDLAGSKIIPVLIGTPLLKRFVVFGNLFATVDNETFRIDRHPTMNRHPITPMDEGDMRYHLAKQTNLPVYSFDLLHQQGSDDVVDLRYKNLTKEHDGFVLFDCLDTRHLRLSGRLVWENRSDDPVIIIGASGSEYALCEWWYEKGEIVRPSMPKSSGSVERLLVMSGSCSPVTEKQIQWGLENGFCGLSIDTAALAKRNTRDQEFNRVVAEAIKLLNLGKDVIVYSVFGPEDPMIRKTQDVFNTIDEEIKSSSMFLGGQQGVMLKKILEQVSLTRVVVAGGDTSGYITRELDIHALEVIMPLSPGAPLCAVHSDTVLFDGLEIVLKGGQVGGANFFEYAKAGEIK